MTDRHSIRLLVCGGRHFNDVPHLWRALDVVAARSSDRIVHCVIDGASDDVTGPYVGADYWAHQWALARNISTIRVHAKWKEQGAAAGPIRNAAMLKEHHPTLVVAFPGDRGTADMKRRAWGAGIEVIEISA